MRTANAAKHGAGFSPLLFIRACLVVATFALFAGCQSAGPRLILIGGGLEEDNDAVWEHLRPRQVDPHTPELSSAATSDAGPLVVVVPLASADREQAVRNARDRFGRRFPGVRVEQLGDPASTEAQRQVRAADLIFFTGGDQSRITRTLLPDGRPSPVSLALSQAASTGTVIAGTSAGCAVMSDPMFTGGGSEAALARLPVIVDEADSTMSASEIARGVRLAQGLGLVPGTIMDSHALQRGRVGRMIAAVEASEVKVAVGVADNRAVAYEARAFTAIGDHAAIVVDGREMHTQGLVRTGVRITLLSDGDRLTLNGRWTPAPPPARGLTPSVDSGPSRLDRPPTEAAQGEYSPDATQNHPLEAWGPDVVVTLLAKLQADPNTIHSAFSERFELRVRADRRTRFSHAVGMPQGAIRVHNAVLDVIPRESGP
ncbi:MAG: Type 1 glutamine amidotransferase-like domain-containing protein [Planctomycetota bacterium]|nr:Type 1 glutamine amidotransferase-like domain-containing protein [Planctomycetota bacterium]